MACVICEQTIDLYKASEYKLTEKGCAGMNKANHERNLDIPDIVFSEDNDLLVHKICISRHTNPKSVKIAQKRQTSQSPETIVKLRSEIVSLASKHIVSCVGCLWNSHLPRRNQTRPVISTVM